MKQRSITLKAVEMIIDNSYSGNELCPICEKWFNIWIEELKKNLGSLK